MWCKKSVRHEIKYFLEKIFDPLGFFSDPLEKDVGYILLVFGCPAEKLHLKCLSHFHLPHLYPDALSQLSLAPGVPLGPQIHQKCS